MDDTRSEIIRYILMSLAVLLEWYMMQPYHEPLLARLWFVLASVAQNIARRFGTLALNAEHNYYIAAEAGI